MFLLVHISAHHMQQTWNERWAYSNLKVDLQLQNKVSSLLKFLGITEVITSQWLILPTFHKCVATDFFFVIFWVQCESPCHFEGILCIGTQKHLSQLLRWVILFQSGGKICPLNILVSTSDMMTADCYICWNNCRLSKFP